MRVLLDNAKKIVTQLNSVMSYEYAVDFRAEDGQLPAYEQLVSKLNDAFRHQRDINQMHAKLLSVNYLVNLSNFAKNRQLSRALSRGKRQIMDLQNTVAVMEEAVDSLTEEVETQRKTAERLKGSLETTRALLETSMLEYRKEMNQQRDIINQQQRYVGAIQRNKYNQDFILDSSLFVFSLWAVNTVLVDYPIQVALSISMRPSRRRQWTRQGLKLVTMMVLLGRLKNGAAAYGLHNRVGSVFPYVQTLLEIARDALLRVFWSAKESSLP
ncbi:hypothetical protein BJ742DRAFT_17767 [Cladochytrium replicatum]|nr:hypothetical protein BJ742DRAFT_17767 [Cladochytrium replicatum]